MEITIKGNTYEVRYTLKAMMAWEAVTRRRFDIVTVTDQWVYYYCLLLSANPELALTFNEFVEALDEEPGLLGTFARFIETETKKRGIFKGSEGDEEEGKKNSR